MAKVRVLYFAILREKVGRPEEALELPAGSRVSDLLAELGRRHPFMAGLRGFRVAIDRRYAKARDEIPDGAEVALIPPVAGGAPAARLHVELVQAAITADRMAELVADAGAGAALVFLGVVRNENEGKRVLHLEYQAYEAMAIAELERIGAELAAAHPELEALALVHRLGDLAIGEASVGVAVSTPHRAEAFTICRQAIDALKERVPIWKREHYQGEEPLWVRADCLSHHHPPARPRRVRGAGPAASRGAGSRPGARGPGSRARSRPRPRAR